MCYAAPEVAVAVALALLPGAKLSSLATDVLERKLGLGGAS